MPSFHVGGWHDLFLQGVLDDYAAMAALGRPARLVVGPWTHKAFADPIGELCYGSRARRLGVAAHPEGDLNDVLLAWFRRHLDGGAPDEPEQGPPVRLFVMGRDEWRDESSWPLSRARTERWQLIGDGSLRPEGTLVGVDGDAVSATSFLCDPAEPVPTRGGPVLLAPGMPSGPIDQRPIEARADVATFTSEPLACDLEVTGPVRVVLHGDSTAPSSDWVARLCDVHPDGRSFNLCDGICRVAAGADRLHRVEVDLWSTCNVFLAGHRLRVHVTGSSFPRWDRNLNTGDQRSPARRVARQRIHHGAERASWIELPVVR